MRGPQLSFGENIFLTQEWYTSRTGLMPDSSAHEITLLLRQWSDGDSEALDKLTPLVFRELHRLAVHYLGRERSEHTLQATGLVNEAYIRLIDWNNVHWQNRSHFYGVTAQVMRRVQQERWRVEQFVDAGFNVAITAGFLGALSGVVGLLWSFGWFSVDVGTVATAVTTFAPWTRELASQAQTLIIGVALLSSALALWWWVEGETV